jgi:two-component system, sensor histidine kinase and response regulator
VHIIPVEPAAYYIKVLNIVIAFSIMLYFFYDIKKTYLKTLDKAINKKKNLETYNALLVQQAISLELKNKDIEDLKNKNEELSSIVYHQLRSPVVSFADILSQYIDHSRFSREEFIEISKLTQVKVNDTLNVIDNVLMWNRKGADGIKPRPISCDLISVFNKAVAQLNLMLIKKDLRIIYPPKASPLVYADADHLLIILLNLLTNAVKFSPVGSNIYIAFFEQNDKCQLHISNYGKGIESAHLQSIFSSLQIVSGKGTMNETGTGLGLKICKNLLEKNNGTIEISSSLNGITTIIIKLPTCA